MLSPPAFQLYLPIFQHFSYVSSTTRTYIAKITQRVRNTYWNVTVWFELIFFLVAVHKDPYENIYCVVAGEKEFILHPPTDLPWIPYNNYPSAVYKKLQNKWTIDAENDAECQNSVPWVTIDPLEPDYKRFHFSFYLRTQPKKYRFQYSYNISVRYMTLDIYLKMWNG